MECIYDRQLIQQKAICEARGECDAFLRVNVERERLETTEGLSMEMESSDVSLNVVFEYSMILEPPMGQKFDILYRP
jgi:hypothetical protein